MPTIQLHYDGWLTLPAEARRHLAVATGSRLEIELTDGGLFLRPAGQTIAASPKVVQAAPSPAAPELAQAKTEPDETAAEIMLPKRGPGRPRKGVPQDLAPRIKVGGRRKSILPA